MKKLLVLLMLAGCGAPLTGDPFADCLAARNTVIQSQNAVNIANGLYVAAVAAHRSEGELDALRAGVSLAQTNLTNAQAMQVSLCTPPAPIIIAGS